MNARSLAFRLVAWYAGVLTAASLLLGALTLLSLQHFLEANLLDSQVRRAHQIADTLVVHTRRGEEALLREQVQALYSPAANDRFMRITRRADGTVVYVSGAPHDDAFDPAVVPVAAAPGVRRLRAGGATLLLAAGDATGADGGSYRVEVGAPADGVQATLAHVLAMLAVGLPCALGVAVVGGFVLVRRALDPVQRIARKAEEITQHNLSERLPVTHSGDEIERVSVSLNHMISRLEEAVRSSKQFVADASHELRTPLAVLRVELEGLAQDGQLSGQTRDRLGSALEEVARLAAIVEGLLALLRLDAGEAHGEWVRVDLAELATVTAGQMSLLAEDKQVSVQCDAPAPVWVDGDRARLKQIVVNLLDNAIKYTPGGGSVRLTVTRQGTEAVLAVSDDGIGIPADALPHVFDRFYRVDTARSREQGGAGLGLSIVRSISGAHGAQVEVESSPGQGSTFRIRQPLAAKA